jgi:5-hydroxyisourate hydrolase
MTLKFDRRALLQTGVAAGVLAASATPARAQASLAKLSTHGLDTYRGKMAAGMRIDLSRKDGDAWKLLKSVTTYEDGRVGEPDPLLSADTMAVGRYELLFYVEEYYRKLA